MFYCFTATCTFLFVGPSSTSVLFGSVIPEARGIVERREPRKYNNDFLLRRHVSTEGKD